MLVILATMIASSPGWSLTEKLAGTKQREGTRVSGLVGDFKETGRRWTFHSETSDLTYRILENQSLERITKAIQEDPQDRHWKIAGELTEYLDENFLLIDRVERATQNGAE
jgi:hypothetical protein